MNQIPSEWGRGTAAYALSTPTCTGRVLRDWLRLPWSLLRYGLATIRYRFLPAAPFHVQDLRPFMCPVCFWGGTWGELRGTNPDEDGHWDESICPRCECEV